MFGHQPKKQGKMAAEKTISEARTPGEKSVTPGGESMRAIDDHDGDANSERATMMMSEINDGILVRKRETELPYHNVSIRTQQSQNKKVRGRMSS
jgi:hypothetical protein